MGEVEQWEIELGKTRLELLDMITANTRDILSLQMDLAEVSKKLEQLEAKINDLNDRVASIEYHITKIYERLGVGRE